MRAASVTFGYRSAFVLTETCFTRKVWNAKGSEVFQARLECFKCLSHICTSLKRSFQDGTKEQRPHGTRPLPGAICSPDDLRFMNPKGRNAMTTALSWAIFRQVIVVDAPEWDYLLSRFSKSCNAFPRLFCVAAQSGGILSCVHQRHQRRWLANI